MKTIHILIIIITLTLLAAPDAQAFSDTGFSNPFGVTVDSKSSYIYVSNVNGGQKSRDDNGFISRLKGDGTVDKLRFIDGASNSITLNAPKGMAVAEKRLYIADIDKLHAFDLATGRFLFDVNFGKLPVQHFYDVALGPDNALYLADGPANTIYRIDIAKQHEVTAFIQGDELGQPHGIVWFPARQVFAIAGWSSGKVTAYDRAGKRQTYPAILLRTLEGIAADDKGNMFVTSTGLSAIYRIGANFALHTFKLAVKSPAGVAFSEAGDELVAASFELGKVESFKIEEDKSKSVVTDFVQPAPAPRPKPPEEVSQKVETEGEKEGEKEQGDGGEKEGEGEKKEGEKEEKPPTEKPSGEEKTGEQPKS